MKKMLLVVPHSDDELLMSVSLILSFEGEFHTVVTSEGDFLPRPAYDAARAQFDAFTAAVTKYRKENDLGPYIIDYFPEYGNATRMGIPEQAHAKIFKTLEDLLKEGEWEYLVYPGGSINPSHVATMRIAEGLCRAPYIFNVKDILMATYMAEFLFQVEQREDCYYVPISEREMEFIRSDLYERYRGKLGAHFPLEKFENSLRFFGDKINVPYAQSFIPRRMIHRG